MAHVRFHRRKWVLTRLRQQDRTQRPTRRNRGVSDGALSLPSERSARSQTSPGRVSERRTLPLLGLGRERSRRTQKAFGAAMRLCASLLRGVAAPLGCVIFSVSVEIAACTPCSRYFFLFSRRSSLCCSCASCVKMTCLPFSCVPYLHLRKTLQDRKRPPTFSVDDLTHGMVFSDFAGELSASADCFRCKVGRDRRASIARGAAPCSEQSDAKQPGHSNVWAVSSAGRTYSRQESIEVRPCYQGII